MRPGYLSHFGSAGTGVNHPRSLGSFGGSNTGWNLGRRYRCCITQNACDPHLRRDLRQSIKELRKLKREIKRKLSSRQWSVKKTAKFQGQLEWIAQKLAKRRRQIARVKNQIKTYRPTKNFPSTC